MRILRYIAIVAATLLPLAGAYAGGDGLVADAARVPWARFQGRVAFVAETQGWRSQFAPVDRTGLKVSGLSVMGDVYFGAAPRGRADAGGFRATSGVIVGARDSRTAMWGSPAAAPAIGRLSVERRLFGQTAASIAADPNEPATLPYVGIGYSSLAPRGGWSFSADLGLVSLSPGNAVRLGRVFGGGQNLDDIIRDMRFAPVLQLGVSYSF